MELVSRVDEATLPKSMKHLKRDHRGFPVPWFVKWINGKPEFRAADGEKFARAIRGKFCWVCGGKIHGNYAFVAGPMCGINRTSSEPPSHIDCARWSALNCPFLVNPRMVRREDDTMNNQQLRDTSAGFAIARNPGVAMVWICRGYEVFDDGRGRPLIQMGAPESVEWYRESRQATAAEIKEAVDSGLPALVAVARADPGGFEYLMECVERFKPWMQGGRKEDHGGADAGGQKTLEQRG